MQAPFSQSLTSPDTAVICLQKDILCWCPWLNQRVVANLTLAANISRLQRPLEGHWALEFEVNRSSAVKIQWTTPAIGAMTRLDTLNYGTRVSSHLKPMMTILKPQKRPQKKKTSKPGGFVALFTKFYLFFLFFFALSKSNATVAANVFPF